MLQALDKLFFHPPTITKPTFTFATTDRATTGMTSILAEEEASIMATTTTETAPTRAGQALATRRRATEALLLRAEATRYTPTVSNALLPYYEQRLVRSPELCDLSLQDSTLLPDCLSPFRSYYQLCQSPAAQSTLLCRRGHHMIQPSTVIKHLP